MAQLLDSEEIVNFGDAMKSLIGVQDALVLLLERKGIITRAELMEEIRSVKEQMARLKG